MPLWLFAFLGTLAVIASLGMVLQRNPVHCLLALVLTMLDLGVIYIGLGAETVGLLQIIIYVGAIMILFLFIIQLLNLQTEPVIGGSLVLKLLGALGAAALTAELAVLLTQASPPAPAAALPVGYGSIASIALSLFSNYLIAFEVTSVLLLAAVVGAIGLARRLPAATQAPVSDDAGENIRSAAG
jgi:NADH-quinone oxidoreductase subunit J